jgi:hypothetical protein
VVAATQSVGIGDRHFEDVGQRSRLRARRAPTTALLTEVRKSRLGQNAAMAGEQRDGGITELGRFLYARRSEVTPADVGLTPGVGLRRTPGLRREEVATLARVSIDYYTRLERGKGARPSPAVVDALARALTLDRGQHEYLRALAARVSRHAPEPSAR